MPRSGSRLARFARYAAGGAVLALLLTGCTSDPLADQYREGSGKNYIAGDGTIAEFAPDSREEPVSFEGATVDGGSFDSADAAGEVVVVNFWYAGCAPCRVEAPILQRVHEQYGDEVAFVGVNVRDQAGTARPFEEDFGITYPSILDVDEGRVQLAFAGKVPAAAVPTTLVLDRDGRVAARILGQVKDASILTTIVDGLLDEAA
ncbi:TlpA family protein disulfide reductase [Agromyces larvae]